MHSVAALMESIEKEYVLVNANFASMEGFSYYLETSVQDASITKVSNSTSEKNDHLSNSFQTKEVAGGAGSSQSHASASLESSSLKSSVLKELQGLTILHPSTRLQLLHQYVHALTELAQLKVSF